MNDQRAIDLITECRDALAEELGAWDIDPPLHHVKAAHDKCVAWLDDHTQQPRQIVRADMIWRMGYDAAKAEQEEQAEPMVESGDDDLPDRLLHRHRAAAAAAVAKWQREQAQQAEPVAWLSIDIIGERYLCFSKPLDNDPVFPLFTHPPQQAEPVAVTWAMVEAAEAAHDAARGNQGGFWRSAVRAMIEAALRANPQQQAKPAQVFQLDEKSRQAHALLDLTSSRPSSGTWTTPDDETGNPSF